MPRLAPLTPRVAICPKGHMKIRGKIQWYCLECRQEWRRAYTLRHQERVTMSAQRRMGVFRNRHRNEERFRLMERQRHDRRRAQKLSTRTGDVSYSRILDRDGYWCHICDNMIIGVTLSEIHFDHVVPLSRGGTHTEDNIHVSHAKCNQRKHNSLSP